MKDKDDDRFLASLGKEVASALGTGPASGRRLLQKEAAASILYGRKRTRAPKIALIASAALLLIAAGVILLLELRERPAQFWIGRSVTVNKDGVWIQAALDEPVRLSFKDGSRVVMEESAGGQILEASTKEVRIVLGKGKISAKVRPGTKAKWTVQAGPYSVVVTGTRFTVFWDEEKTIFEVAVSEGKVTVKGNWLDEDGMVVAAGSRLYINKKESVITMGPIEEPGKIAAAEPVPAGPGQPLPAPGTGEFSPDMVFYPGDMPAVGAGPEALALDGHVPSEWKKLADEGRYAEALQAAEKDGFDGLLETASLADLWRLADTARYAGDADKAQKTLLMVRSRFSKSKRAKIAAFLLGRVAIDLKKKPGEGVGWFRTCLKEDPGGPLEEEALGRLLDAYLKMGGIEKAQGVAEVYLSKYENGAFAELARTTLDEP